MGRQVSHPMMKRQRTACMCLCVDARLHGLTARYSSMGYKPFSTKAFLLNAFSLLSFMLPSHVLLNKSVLKGERK